MPKELTDLAVRKKMRKGTHSCFECRRRKIRCIFPPENQDVCSECFARGSRCIDQEHANPDVVVDHRKNLRERVSRLEALVDSLLEEKTEQSQADTNSSKTPNLVTRDTFPPTPLSSEASSSIFRNDQQRAPSERGHHVPILSAFEDALNDAEMQIKARLERAGSKDLFPAPPIPTETPVVNRYTVECTNGEDLMNDTSAKAAAKKERAKKALLDVLPPYDQLNKILNSNSEWWQTWRRKCSGTSTPDQTLAQFTTKALSENNIGAIGTVVLSVGICIADEDDIERYIEAVDRWILADDEYAATLEGMECLILKAKWYADVGQPRRAWIAYRKGLMYTQLMGLHRKRTASAAHESIWWSLYHGDRFLSLLLGLPYGISDSHCDLSLPEMSTPSNFLAPLTFMNKMSILAGKVIDRNQGIAEQSFAWALQLDQELEDLWKRLDPNWLEYNELLADIDKNAADLRERLMAQMVYHQIRVYLHLPFMLKSQSNSRFSYSRTACLNGSREVLRLYQALRTGEVQPLYECKAVDFIGFTAAVLIMLGLFNYGASNAGTSPKDQETDIRLIEMSIDIFRRASSEKGGKVALQSAQVLEKMLLKLKVDWGKAPTSCTGGQGSCDDMTDFVIPYFGTITIRRGGQVQSHQDMQRQKLEALGKMNASMSGGKYTGAPFGSGTGTQPGSQRQASLSSATGTNSASATTFTPTSEKSSTDLFGAPTNTSTSTMPPAGLDGTAFNFNTDFISYDGFYNWPSSTLDPSTVTSPSTNATTTTTTNNPSTGANMESLNPHVNDDSMGNFPLPTNNFSWQNMPMDIDQDWSWFLNDAQTVNNGQQPAADTTMNNFAGNTYAGFG